LGLRVKEKEEATSVMKLRGEIYEYKVQSTFAGEMYVGVVGETEPYQNSTFISVFKI
jgi:hypothetical protein